jgi:hypothetical protein
MGRIEADNPRGLGEGRASRPPARMDDPQNPTPPNTACLTTTEIEALIAAQLAPGLFLFVLVYVPEVVLSYRFFQLVQHNLFASSSKLRSSLANHFFADHDFNLNVGSGVRHHASMA